MDQTTIPAFPEVTITGMKQQLMPRILECNQGGYLVIFDGHGVSAVSSFGEAIDKIMEVGSAVFGEDYQPDLPRVARADYQEPPPPLPTGLRAVDIKRMMHVAIATVATCLIAIGIKIT